MKGCSSTSERSCVKHLYQLVGSLASDCRRSCTTDQQPARQAREQHMHQSKPRRSKPTSTARRCSLSRRPLKRIPPQPDSVTFSSATAHGHARSSRPLLLRPCVPHESISQSASGPVYISTRATQHGGRGCGGCRPPAASAARQHPAPPQLQSPQPGLSKPCKQQAVRCADT